ncbi:Predicted ATPase [Lachnospiraceae bacterium YSD2013]|nr:Predicted ATPase [Lachnospiraceae bacterium YSD2013]
MRLINLQVQGYKNLQNINIDFLKSDGQTLLVGTNGSGKSNLLEVLSAIFSALYENNRKVEPEFKFVLCYEKDRPEEINVDLGEKIKVRIDNNDGSLSVAYSKLSEDNYTTVSPDEWLSLMPDHVIAVYSGEEDRLWQHYYFSSYNKYNKQYLEGKKAYQEERMIFLNHYYWELLASILAVDDISDHNAFVSDVLGLKSITGIKLTFDVNKIKRNKNDRARTIINLLNPDEKDEVIVSLDKYHEALEFSGFEKNFLFDMSVLTLHKDFKIITGLKILCDGEIQIESLSEGEKKLLLIYSAINIPAGENLYLFDEPDAHLHEGRKHEIYDLMQTDSKSDFVVSSHSPTLTSLFNYNKVLFVKNEHGSCVIENGDIAKVISEITNSEWNYIDHTLVMDSTRPLIITEGDGDVKYIKKAISELEQNDTKYSELKDVDFLHCGGALSVENTINELKTFLPNDKKIIAVFDRDNGGLDGLKKVTGKTNIGKGSKKCFKEQNVCSLMLPIKEGYTASDFVIEDYFSEKLKKDLAQQEIDNSTGEFNNLPGDIKKIVKKRLADRLDSYSAQELRGFSVLLDKLIKIVDETEAFVNV